MHILDYTSKGRKPSVRKIVSDWKKAGRPVLFQVKYGEVCAEYVSFEQMRTRWFGCGNGRERVKRNQVVTLLEKESA